MDSFESDEIKIWIEDEILYLIYKTAEINLPIAQRSVNARIQVCKTKTYPLLGDIRRVKSITRPARKFLSSGKSQDLLSAGAFIINSHLQKFIVNFWLQIDRPKLPAKIFTDESKALKWLENYKINNLISNNGSD